MDFAALNQNTDGLTNEQRLQDEISGDNVKLNFHL